MSVDDLFKLIEAIPISFQLRVLQNYIAGIDDPRLAKLAEIQIFTRYRLGPDTQKHHILTLIHGIRTRAEWQERIVALAKMHAPEVEVIPIGYGRLRSLRFAFPRLFGEKPIALVLKQLRSIRADNPNAEVSIIAHSFGTYITAAILANFPDIRLNRIQLCGSIISTQYDWHAVKKQRIGTVSNDVGSRDCWPVIAEKVSNKYGSTGAYGFKQSGVKDNFHNLGHSDFFTESHFLNFWLPFISDGHVVISEWNKIRPAPPVLFRAFDYLIELSILIAGVCFTIYWFLLRQ
jgi:pimeloyl-ACP methyl ester carboxylesterase